MIKPLFFTCHWISTSNGCYNPFIYAIFSKNFKKELKQRNVCQKIFCHQEDSQQIVAKSDQIEMNPINKDEEALIESDDIPTVHL